MRSDSRIVQDRPGRRTAAILAFLAAAAAGAAPATRPTVTELEVAFVGAGGAKLAGTLAEPADVGGRRLPALVLLAGSGPTDRNGNVPPTVMDDLLRTLADRLARRGIVTLRYDKRGMYANAADRPPTAAGMADYFAWQPFVGDAEAAVTFLRGRPGVDPGRVGILGHSEGGLLALCAAAGLSKDGGRPPAALVLVAGPGRPYDALIDEQLAALVQRQHATTRQAADVLGANRRVIASLRSTGRPPADGVPTSLAALYPAYLNRFWHEALAVDPPALATAYAGPVLVVNGTADEQVSADRDAQPLGTALSRRSNDDHRLLLPGGLNHFLKPAVAAPGTPYGGGDVPPAVLDAIVGWTADHLSSPHDASRP